MIKTNTSNAKNKTSPTMLNMSIVINDNPCFSLTTGVCTGACCWGNAVAGVVITETSSPADCTGCVCAAVCITGLAGVLVDGAACVPVLGQKLLILSII